MMPAEPCRGVRCARIAARIARAAARAPRGPCVEIGVGSLRHASAVPGPVAPDLSVPSSQAQKCAQASPSRRSIRALPTRACARYPSVSNAAASEHAAFSQRLSRRTLRGQIAQPHSTISAVSTTAWNSTFAPFSAQSGVISSASLWLEPVDAGAHHHRRRRHAVDPAGVVPGARDDVAVRVAEPLRRPPHRRRRSPGRTSPGRNARPPRSRSRAPAPRRSPAPPPRSAPSSRRASPGPASGCRR